MAMRPDKMGMLTASSLRSLQDCARLQSWDAFYCVIIESLEASCVLLLWPRHFPES